MGLEKNGKVAWNKFNSGHINGDKIFSLLTKNIKIDNPNKILLLGLESPVFYKLTKEKYPNSDIDFICDDDIKSTLSFCKFIPENNIFYIDFDDNNILNLIMDNIKNKKYDLIVGNPPYDRSLHLKIIDEAIKHLTNDGKACFIHPARWIEDPLWEIKKSSAHKKYENSLINHIENIQLLKAKKMNILFNINITTDLMISLFSNKLTNNNDLLIYNKIAKSCINKILNKKHITFNDKCEYNKIDGWRCEVKFIYFIVCSNADNRQPLKNINIVWKDSFFNGYDENNVYWTEGRLKNQYSKKINDVFPCSIKFNKKINADNFIKSTSYSMFFTNMIHMFLSDMHTPLFAIPYIINNEHGEYDKPWTDEDYCKYFDLTEEESEFMCREVYDYREKDYINYTEIL